MEEVEQAEAAEEALISAMPFSNHERVLYYAAPVYPYYTKEKPMIKHKIKHRYTGEVLFTAEIDCETDAPLTEKRGKAVLWAIENGKSLSCAELNGAVLGDADLTGVDLRGADLSSGANLNGAVLIGANLNGAKLWRANLGFADMTAADLSGADLTGVDLSFTNLFRADLRGAILSDTALDEKQRNDAYLLPSKLKCYGAA